MLKKLILLPVGRPSPVLHRAGGSSEGNLVQGAPRKTQDRPVSVEVRARDPQRTTTGNICGALTNKEGFKIRR